MSRFMMIAAAAATFVLAVLGARVAAHAMADPETQGVSRPAASAGHASAARDVEESRFEGAVVYYIDQRIDRRPERRFDQRFHDRAFY
jgi:hypothetical protein